MVTARSFQQQGALQLSVAHRTEVAKGTYEVSFRVKPDDLLYKPGQYVRITIPKLRDDPRGPSRDFSIASAPGSDRLSVVFRSSDSPFKRSLLGSKRLKVAVDGPFGVFTLPETPDGPLVFIAGGIGISPFISMLRHMKRHDLPYSVRLICANNDRTLAAYHEELFAYERLLHDFKFISHIGRLSKERLRSYLSDAMRSKYYVAGPSLMVKECYSMLASFDIPTRDIFTEEFVGYDVCGNFVRHEDVAHNHVVHPTRMKQFSEEFEGQLGTRSLSDLEALLQALNDTAIVSETNADGTITFVNDKFVELSKYSREELVGQNHRILKSDYHPRAFYDNLWATITRGRLWRGRIKNQAKDGSYYWVDTSIAPIMDPSSNTPRKYISVRFPITERQQAEEALEERARQQSVLTDLSQAALTMHRLSDLFMSATKQLAQTAGVECCAVLRYQPQQKRCVYEAGVGLSHAVPGKTVIGAGANESLAGYTIAKKEPVVLQDLLSESRFSGCAVLHDHAIASGFSVLIQGPETPFGVMYVMSLKKRSFVEADINFAQAVANLLANAAQNHLDKRKDEFLGIASHELKTPLTSIKTFTQLLIEHEKRQNDAHSLQFLTRIESQVNKLTELTHALLDISRVNSGKLEYNDERFLLDVLVQEVVDEEQLACKKHVLDLGENAHTELYGDRYRIGQVLTNLILNAVKYSPKQDRVSISSRIEDDQAVISIEDFGVGISKQDQNHIFERFYRGRNNEHGRFHGGMGLGLYLCAEIVARHNGTLTVQSKEKQGSIFTVSLPIIT